MDSPSNRVPLVLFGYVLRNLNEEKENPHKGIIQKIIFKKFYLPKAESQNVTRAQVKIIDIFKNIFKTVLFQLLLT